MDKNKISLNNNYLISHIVSYHILCSFLDRDLQPDDGLVKRVKSCSTSKLYPVHKHYML